MFTWQNFSFKLCLWTCLKDKFHCVSTIICWLPDLVTYLWISSISWPVIYSYNNSLTGQILWHTCGYLEFLGQLSIATIIRWLARSCACLVSILILGILLSAGVKICLVLCNQVWIFYSNYQTSVRVMRFCFVWFMVLNATFNNISVIS